MKEDREVHWKDYYLILQVHPSAEPEVIEATYNRLDRKYHPDVNKDPKATERMKNINEAHQILGNPEKRKRYHITYLQKTGTNINIPNPQYTTQTEAKPNPKPSQPEPTYQPSRILFTKMV